MAIHKYPHTNLHIALIEPEIPNNTGNIGRTCVGNYCDLHLVGQLGFEISDKQLRRAGLDYWQHLQWQHHLTYEAWWGQVASPERTFFFSTKAKRSIFEVEFKAGDWLVFGKETKGLGPEILSRHSEHLVKIPFEGPIRSLNLASAVSIATYEALRQIWSKSPGQQAAQQVR